MGSLALRPDDSLAILTMALSIGFRNSVAFLSAIQATGLLTFAPVGLPPTEHASLHWTHPSVTIYLACLTARGFEVPLHAPQQGRLHCFSKADWAYTNVDTGGEFKRAGPGPENWLRLGSDTPESDSNVRSTLLCWPMKLIRHQCQRSRNEPQKNAVAKSCSATSQ